MVQKVAEIQPRSSGTTTLVSLLNDDGIIRPEQARSSFILENGLDEYAETTILETHSQDPNFDKANTLEEGTPTLPGRERTVAITDPAELLEFQVDTPTAPTSGTFTVWRVDDDVELPLDSANLNTFKELNEGRTYTSDFQEELTDQSTITAGIRQPSDAETSLFIRQFGLGVGGDALITTEIDHDSYTDGSSVPVLNKKPELQLERPLNASVTQDPTISGAQGSMTAFLPGGTGGVSTGNRFSQADFELTPGQDLTIQIQNVSNTTNNFGFGLELIETVIR